MIRWLFLAAFVGATVFVAAIVLVRQHYKIVSTLQLDPLGERYIRHQGLDRHYELVMVGDSRAYHWSLENTALDALKLAVPGSTTKQALLLYRQYYGKVSADAVLIQVGVNDLKYLAIQPDRSSEIIRECIENINMMIEMAIESGAQVYISTIFPHGEVPISRKLFWSADVSRGIEKVNEAILHAQFQGGRVTILDSDAVLKDDDGYLKRHFAKDFLHLNEAGYSALNNALRFE